MKLYNFNSLKILTVKPLSRLEEIKEIKIEPDHQQPGGFLNYSKFSRDPEDVERY